MSIETIKMLKQDESVVIEESTADTNTAHQEKKILPMEDVTDERLKWCRKLRIQLGMTRFGFSLPLTPSWTLNKWLMDTSSSQIMQFPSGGIRRSTVQISKEVVGEWVWPEHFFDPDTLVDDAPAKSKMCISSDKVPILVHENEEFLKKLKTSKIILLLHGGAYCFLNRKFYRCCSFNFAKLMNVFVLVINYRRPPYVTINDSIDDALCAFNFLKKLGVSVATQLTLFGDSAGGGLSVNFLKRLQALEEKLPASLILSSPWVDANPQNDIESGPYHPMQKKDYIQPGSYSYKKLVNILAKNEGATLDDPILSPLRNDLSGFPPTLMIYSEWESFFRQDTEFVEVMKNHGVPIVSHVIPHMIHNGFLFAETHDPSKKYMLECKPFIDNPRGYIANPSTREDILSKNISLDGSTDTTHSHQMDSSNLEPRSAKDKDNFESCCTFASDLSEGGPEAVVDEDSFMVESTALGA